MMYGIGSFAIYLCPFYSLRQYIDEPDLDLEMSSDLTWGQFFSVVGRLCSWQLRADGALTSKNGQLAARSAASAHAFSDALEQALQGDDVIGKAGIGVPLVNAQAKAASA